MLDTFISNSSSSAKIYNETSNFHVISCSIYLFDLITRNTY